MRERHAIQMNPQFHLTHRETEAMDPDHLKTPVAAQFHVEKTTPIAYILICIKVETVRHFL